MEIAKPKQTCARQYFSEPETWQMQKHWPEGWLYWKPISGILLELVGCLLTQNELISLHGALSAQSVHDIRLATQPEMGWWRDSRATRQLINSDGFPFRQACHLYFLLLPILIKHSIWQESVLLDRNALKNRLALFKSQKSQLFFKCYSKVSRLSK